MPSFLDEFRRCWVLQPFQSPRARDEGYPTPQSSTAAMSPIDRAASGEEDAEVTEVQQRSGDSLSFAWNLRCFLENLLDSSGSKATKIQPERTKGQGFLFLWVVELFQHFFSWAKDGWVWAGPKKLYGILLAGIAEWKSRWVIKPNSIFIFPSEGQKCKLFMTRIVLT